MLPTSLQTMHSRKNRQEGQKRKKVLALSFFHHSTIYTRKELDGMIYRPQANMQNNINAVDIKKKHFSFVFVPNKGK